MNRTHPLMAGPFIVCLAGAAAAIPPGFVEEVVVQGFNEPVGLAFAPGGDRIFVWQKDGIVRIVDNGVLLPAPLIDLSQEVNVYWTRGLTGFALDPDYANNGYVYLMYTVDWEYHITNGNPNQALLDTNHDTFGRLVRYTSDPIDDFMSLIPESRWEMIGDSHDNGFAVTLASHTQNSIVFAPDGSMLLSAGDGASMLGIDIGGPRDSCCSSNTAESDGVISEKEQIGAFRAQLVDTHSGKILRIDPATGEGLSSNPFYDEAAPSSPRSRVWSLGLRNPFTFAIRPGTGSLNPAGGDPGVLVIGDVGWDTWERLVVSTGPGQNFGWPIYEGLLAAGGGYATVNVANQDAPNPLFGLGGCTQEFFLFKDLLVQETLNVPAWPNPCDARQQIPAEYTFMHTRADLIWRNSRVFTTPFSMVGIFDGNGNAQAASITHPDSPIAGPHLKGVATVGGVFYDSNKFPAEYDGAYFFAEAGSASSTGWIHAAWLDETHQMTEVTEFRETGAVYPTTLVLDPDGYALYYANHRPGVLGQIRRIVVDCNGNGIGDDDDIAGGTSTDCNGNGIPDECDTPGDLNGDGTVGAADLAILLGGWGACPPRDTCCADLNGDGTVDAADLAVVLGNWG